MRRASRKPSPGVDVSRARPDRTTGTLVVEDIFTVAPCSVPPVPSGFVATAGIGIVILDWDNPHRICGNHGLTKIYRGTSDVFGDADEIGSNTGIIHVDDSVADDTDYWYWARWVSNSSPPVEGQLTVAAMVHTAVDPEQAIAEISAEILNDPLIDEITSADDALVNFERVQRVRMRTMLLINNAVNSRMDYAGHGDRRWDSDHTRASHHSATSNERCTFTLGETPNTFDGDTLADAEQALDAYTDDAANSPFGSQTYDGDATKYVVLEFD